MSTAKLMLHAQPQNRCRTSLFPRPPFTDGTFQSFGTHTGHFRLKPELIKRSLKDVTDKEKELARQCNQLRFRPAAAAMLINFRDELGMKAETDEDQIRYLKRKDAMFQNLGDKSTVADRLMKKFAAMDDAAHVAVTCTPTQGLMMSARGKDRKKVCVVVENGNVLSAA